MDISLQSLSKNPLSEKLSELITATKNLAFQSVSKDSQKKKLVISSNLLDVFNWHTGSRTLETVIGKGKGLRITKAPLGTPDKKVKLVYERSYKRGNRRNETLVDIRHQQKISDAFLGAHRAHIVITKDEILIKPLFDATSLPIKAGTVRVPNIEEYKDAILIVLDTIKQNRLTHVSFEADSNFWESHDALLLTTQLRRMGYTHDLRKNVFKAIQRQPKDLVYKDIRLSKCNRLKAPSKNLDFKESFVAFSAGFDAHLLEKEGFKVTSALEYSPIEKRDKTDRTEQYVCTMLANNSVKRMFNEDIYHANIDYIAQQTKEVGHLHISLSCTDFSTLKTNAAKQKAFDELTTSRDMFIPTLELIEKQAPATISIENVPSFASSREYEILESRLTRLGFEVKPHILFAPDHGGLTSRKRLYIFCSRLGQVLNHFPAPARRSKTRNAFKAIAYDFSNMRDVSHTNSITKGKAQKRLRPFSRHNAIAPSIFRAQNRQLKDTLYIYYKGKYFLPTIDQLRTLSGMPDSFDMSFLTQEQQTAVIGQGVDTQMHYAWLQSISKYLENVLRPVQLSLL